MYVSDLFGAGLGEEMVLYSAVPIMNIRDSAPTIWELFICWESKEKHKTSEH